MIDSSAAPNVPASLSVRLNDYPVGFLTRRSPGNVAFEFTQRYLDDPDRPTLSLGAFDSSKRLRNKPYASSLGAVPPFFANLLPEGELREIVARRAGVPVDDDFALLWVTGEDVSGAVTLRDALGRSLLPEALRFSLAGAQLKFSATVNAHDGFTIGEQGRDGDWVVKLPSAKFAQVNENEFAMLRFAEAVGIDVPEIRLVDVDSITGLPVDVEIADGPALAVRRFDREPDGWRTHVEDFNQIYRQDPKLKYDNRAMADIVETLSVAAGSDAVVELIRRLVFCIGIGNGDMHLKNWSVIYRDGRTPSLAPAYDYVCTKPYVGNAMALAIGSARTLRDASFDQLGRLAGKARLTRNAVERPAREMVERMRDVWPSLLDTLPTDAIREAIEEQFATVPLFAERK